MVKDVAFRDYNPFRDDVGCFGVATTGAVQGPIA